MHGPNQVNPFAVVMHSVGEAYIRGIMLTIWHNASMISIKV